MAVPFIGRLHPYVAFLPAHKVAHARIANNWSRSMEYIALVVSFILVSLEAVIRICTLALRKLPRPDILNTR